MTVAAGATVKFEGADRLRSTLRSAASDLGDLSAPGREAGSIVAASASARAPRRTGQLAGSVSYEARGNDVSVGSALVYAPIQEYGNPRRGIRPQPYLNPALDESTDQIATSYEQALDGVVAQIKGT